MKIVLIPKKVKRINMRLKDGAILVTYPAHLNKEAIAKIVMQNQTALEKMLESYKRSYRFIGDKIYLFGKPYQLKYQSADHDAVIIKDDLCSVMCSDPFKINQIVVLRFKKELDTYIQKYYKEFHPVLKDYGLDQKINFKYRLLKSAWGVCRPKKNEITINLELVHYPLDAIKSVVYHELVHLIVPNHSKRFYDILLRHMPDYQKIHQLLR